MAWVGFCLCLCPTAVSVWQYWLQYQGNWLKNKQKRVTYERIWCRRALYFHLYILLWMVSLNMKLLSQKREQNPRTIFVATLCCQGTCGQNCWQLANYLWLHTVYRQSICGSTLLTGKVPVAAHCWQARYLRQHTVTGKVSVAAHCLQAKYLWLETVDRHSIRGCTLAGNVSVAEQCWQIRQGTLLLHGWQSSICGCTMLAGTIPCGHTVGRQCICGCIKVPKATLLTG